MARYTVKHREQKVKEATNKKKIRNDPRVLSWRWAGRCTNNGSQSKKKNTGRVGRSWRKDSIMMMMMSWWMIILAVPSLFSRKGLGWSIHYTHPHVDKKIDRKGYSVPLSMIQSGPVVSFWLKTIAMMVVVVVGLSSFAWFFMIFFSFFLFVFVCALGWVLYIYFLTGHAGGREAFNMISQGWQTHYGPSVPKGRGPRK